MIRSSRAVRLRSIGSCLGVVLLASGCGFLGPESIRNSRANYNVAIQRTSDEQLLLNLVRLKYRDTPFFLQISSVTSQLTFNASASAEATLVEAGDDRAGIGAGAAYEETPTISYVPLQGDEFVERFLSPVSISTILLLNSSGWRLDRVLRLTVQRLNGVKNAPTASGPTPTLAPEFANFTRVARLWEALEKANAIEFGFTLRDEERIPVLRVIPEAPESSEVAKFRERLGLSPRILEYPLTLGTGAPTSDGLNIQTRSLLGIMFYLSQSVEVPEAHRSRGLVTVTRRKSGALFDWHEVTGDLMKIRSASAPPSDAAVATRYRGSWFYLDDVDLESKSTFALLAQIFSLQAGRISREGPVLTLPVGGG